MQYIVVSGEMQRRQTAGEHAGGAGRRIRLRLQGRDRARHLHRSSSRVSTPYLCNEGFLIYARFV